MLSGPLFVPAFEAVAGLIGHEPLQFATSRPARSRASFPGADDASRQGSAADDIAYRHPPCPGFVEASNPYIQLLVQAVSSVVVGGLVPRDEDPAVRAPRTIGNTRSYRVRARR